MVWTDTAKSDFGSPRRPHRGDVGEVLDELGAVFCCWNKYPEILEYLSCSRYLSVGKKSASVRATRGGSYERGEERKGD